uniref:Chromosome 5 open reading frame 34 n=1 Tax=Varanus komodoensis TaxID=61221 RepID=A0A8D2ISH5_VARKO
MESENFMVLYEDNSVEVYYLDGSRLLLSPCGSEFLFEHAVPASAHPLQPPERVRQRTQFAITHEGSADNEHVCSDRKKHYIYEASWPSPDTAHETICMHNGIVKVSSLDGHTCLFLPELQQDFTVEFFCKVSQKLSMPLPFLERGCNESTQDQCGTSSQHSVLKLPSKQLKTEEKDSLSFKATKNHAQDSISSPAQTDHENCSSEYSKVIQHMSVSSCPEEWKYPLSLAFMFYQLHACNRAEADEGNQKSEDMQLDASQCEMSKAITCLPSALPLSCHAPYLHRWTFMDFIQLRKEDCLYSSHSQAIKVLWNKGVIYRLEKITVCVRKSMEIYPGDGSVFKSEGSFLGKYFTRYFIQEKTKQREETMYSVSSLPPDIPGSPYSVGEVITQAVRILQHDLENILSLAHNYSVCCWKVSPEMHRREMLPVPLAENVIPNVGRFFAYPDNKIHAVFHDGMILNMVWDFGSPYGKSQVSIKRSWCKLTSPEGSQQLLHIDHPGDVCMILSAFQELFNPSKANIRNITLMTQVFSNVKDFSKTNSLSCFTDGTIDRTKSSSHLTPLFFNIIW